MDLISIARRYKNVRRIIKIVILIVVAVYMCFIIGKYLKNVKEVQETINIEKLQQELPEEKQEEIVEQEEVLKPVFTEQWTEKIKNIYKAEEKRVYLTFDDGPSKKVTIPILDLLKQENIKATFFVLGSRVDLNPNIVKRAYEEGHYIANHGYSHTYSQIYNSPESVLEEYYKTEDAIKRAIGDNNYTSGLFRFPGGSTGGKYAQIKKQAIEKLKEKNIAYVDWNALTGDAEGKNRTVEELIQRLDETIKNRNSIVILMHDAGDKTTTYEALPQIISNLRASGYEFKNFYDLIEYEKEVQKNDE